MQYVFLFFLLINVTNLVAQDHTAKYPVYKGNDLGLTYTPKQSTFKIWSPTAVAARINFYKTDLGGVCDRTVQMEKAANGVLTCTIPHNV